ncbi:BRCA1-A complex subunit BRE [Mytilus galloprovincialis]|uniref:BRISC and BRCA1-A complex member 2 n=1 Tax=Mytilus galloprovincialis TaxID=29158 RepID=A0A8B6C110_MYTGA|nr:BRCA1-A complex subunit BRE [Mytilus galloprovincialis]
MNHNDYDVLLGISPDIRQFAETLIEHSCFGICGGKARLTDVRSGSVSFIAGCEGDRFKVLLPYAGQTLTWEVIFDKYSPEESPDFIFGSEDTDFSPDIADIKTLVDWDYHNPYALLQVIEELLRMYKAHQERIVEAYDRLQFEYSSLVNQSDITSQHVEVHILRFESKVGPISFLIRLPVDFTRIPPFLSKDNPGEDSAILLISFLSPSSSKITPQLYLSPKVEHALGGAANLRIPAFPSDGCLLDYVPNVSNLLSNKVDQVVANFEKRKEYIAAFLSHFGRSLLEYDADAFTKISFLFEWNDFFFIFLIDLPQFFPQEQPEFKFQSIYHQDAKRKPFIQPFGEYPYSPRWTGNEMAQRAKSFILKNISDFQKASVHSGSLN